MILRAFQARPNSPPALCRREYLLELRWRTALLVSDPLHMLRLKTIAQDNGIDSRSSPTRSTRYKSRWAQTRFLLREAFYYSGYRLLRYMPVQNNSIIP